MTRRLPLLAALLMPLLAPLLLAGCERSLKNMYDQPRDKAYSANPLFADGASSRTPPAGTVPNSRGALAGTSSGRHGQDAVAADARAAAAASQPYPVTAQLLLRGQERYSIYCLPCHSPAGDGDGRVVRRGFPAPPSFHTDRLRQASDRHIFEVIGAGYGVMAPYGDRIRATDRWAIVAFVRALQLSQHAYLSDLPPDVQRGARQALEKTDGGAAP
ncbi:c-type cytochrome [Pollutimonas bauzanensis]|nr:cytochrome c [Pollutimonas bauzanensis]